MMEKWPRTPELPVWLAIAIFLLAACTGFGIAAEPEKPRPIRERQLPAAFPNTASLRPAASIPVNPLGFSGPGPLYLGERNAMASLAFIGEDRLLFTFRVPGLIRREHKPGEEPDSDVRQIRALVIDIAKGAVEAEALWSVHDRTRYLWMLKDGHFLLRDRENLSEGDDHLNLKPLLRFPGRLLRMGLDPTQQYMVTNSIEPAKADAESGNANSTGATSASETADEETRDSSPPKFVVRILRRDDGRVMFVSRTRGVVHLPINSVGYLENLRGPTDDWTLNMNYFKGGSHLLGSVNSKCAPNNEFITEQLILATGCDSSEGIKLVAITTEGRILWDDLNPPTAVWPVQFQSDNGLRIGFETLSVTHGVGPYSPLDNDDIKGQLVRILDSATGEIVFEAPASPVLDMGGNAALSPSGRKVAVVNAGAIQVFNLPPAPPIPDQPKQ
jgi:hypothetical protein